MIQKKEKEAHFQEPGKMIEGTNLRKVGYDFEDIDNSILFEFSRSSCF